MVIAPSFLLYCCPTMQVTAQVSSSLLLMAVMGLLFPAALHATGTELQIGKSELVLSRFSSIVMLVAYTAYLYFQLKSHRDLYDSEEVKNHLGASWNYQSHQVELLFNSMDFVLGVSSL